MSIELLPDLSNFDEYVRNLIEVKENWLITSVDGEPSVLAFGQTFPLVHPFHIYSKLYRTETNPETRYKYFKCMHDYLWPKEVAAWHYWTERRFRAHCGDYRYISLASGTSTGKSRDAAKIAVLFWLSNQKGHAVVIASTTLDSLESRIWGYALRLLKTAAIPIEYLLLTSKPPKILCEAKNKKDKDSQHGIFAVAAKRGDDENSINTWIGRHPDDGLMLVLDEGTDMPPALIGAFPNLEGNQKWFQCMIIGNSASKTDLHGALSTPLNGWESIDHNKQYEWETTRKKGICLYFHPEDSPAIHEVNPEKKKLLSTFLINSERLAQRKKQLGEESIEYWRMIVGFWKPDTVEDVVVTAAFAKSFDISSSAEWSGLFPLRMFAGLDAAFSTGGDKCILRIGILGVTVSGLWVMDFRGTDLLFELIINALSPDPAEIQIAKQAIEILKRYAIPLNHLAVDSNGQGRALSSVIQLVAQKNQMASSHLEPIKIYSTKSAVKVARSFDVIIKSSIDLWWTLRGFTQNHQIRGLDDITHRQLVTRQTVTDNNTGKQKLESKLDYKKRMAAVDPTLARSPDEADAMCLAVQAAIMVGGFSEGQVKSIPVATNFIDEKAYAHVQNMAAVKKMMGGGEERKPLTANFGGSLTSFAKSARSWR